MQQTAHHTTARPKPRHTRAPQSSANKTNTKHARATRATRPKHAQSLLEGTALVGGVTPESDLDEKIRLRDPYVAPLNVLQVIRCIGWWGTYRMMGCI